MFRPEKMTNRNTSPTKPPCQKLSLGILAWLFSISASAAGLGEITLHSAIGQPLRATIKVSLGDNEEIERGCFVVAPPGDPELSALSPGQVALKYDSERLLLTLSSTTPINDPIVVLSINMGCGQSLRRDYTLMPDPPPSRSGNDSFSAPIAQTGETVAKPAKARRKKQGSGNGNGPQGATKSPIAALDVRGQDRIRLGPEPSELAPGELAIAPRSELGEIEDRLLKLETTLTSLNREVDALGAALSITAEQTTLSNKLRAAQANQAGFAPPSDNDGTRGKNLANWLELLFSALVGGAITSGIALWLSRRQSRLVQI